MIFLPTTLSGSRSLCLRKTGFLLFLSSQLPRYHFGDNFFLAFQRDYNLAGPRSSISPRIQGRTTATYILHSSRYTVREPPRFFFTRRHGLRIFQYRELSLYHDIFTLQSPRAPIQPLGHEYATKDKNVAQVLSFLVLARVRHLYQKQPPRF